jgi:hypothetical protein
VTAGLRIGCLHPRLLEGPAEELACAHIHYRHCQELNRQKTGFLETGHSLTLCRAINGRFYRHRGDVVMRGRAGTIGHHTEVMPSASAILRRAGKKSHLTSSQWPPNNLVAARVPNSAEGSFLTPIGGSAQLLLFGCFLVQRGVSRGSAGGSACPTFFCPIAARGLHLRP